ncbi:hypothetical protein LZQ00_00770 [Sphingobacterium sp. SRCM116780]|uniref:hypothetical protein n=1 Tax=Sphingobacterium sp. SRCM116780 TaxID=2907623 RepID=UPI001F20594E|nr:hypothetical protein [Sphingobacterium sp. SRCM116780]UIR56375.1 hypothetical protein LZQ00_00770 [Sphingobacterium sp. SRCM116780]
MKTYKFKICIVALFAIGLTQSFVSCSKNEESAKIAADGSSVLFNIAGIQDPNETSTVGTAASNEKQARSTNTGNIQKIYNFSDFDVETSQAAPQTQTSIIQVGNGVLSSGNQARTLRAAVMATGIKYRVMIYNNATGAFVTSVELTAGQADPIPLEKGVEYAYYAFSYNTTASIADLNHTTPTVPTKQDADFLFVNGTFTIPNINPNQVVNINQALIFTRKVMRIGAVVDTRGLGARIVSANVKYTVAGNFYTGNFDLKSNTMTKATPSFTPTSYASPLTLQQVNPTTTKDSVMAGYFYFIKDDASPTTGGATIQVSNLNVAYSSSTSQTYTGPYSFTFNTAAEATNLSLNWYMKFTKNFVVVEGVKWAKGNLYDDGSILSTNRPQYISNNPFRRFNNDNFNDTYFYNAKASVGDGGNSAATNSGDPCRRVLNAQSIAGDWRTPTSSEINKMINSSQITSGKDLASGFTYIKFTSDGNPNDNVTFAMLGQFNWGSGSWSKPNEGFYWSNDGNTPGYYALKMKTDAAGAAPQRTPFAGSSSGLFDYYHVRCVRAN